MSLDVTTTGGGGAPDYRRGALRDENGAIYDQNPTWAIPDSVFIATLWIP